MPISAPRPFTNTIAIEDRILIIDHDPFLPFCSEFSEPDSSDSGADFTSAED